LVKVLNPLSSELEVLRQSLLYGGLEAVLYNQNRKTGNIKFYEFGKIYAKGEKGYEENKRLMLMMAGDRETENWNQPEQEVDFYDLKKYAWLLLDRLGINRFSLKTDENLPPHFEYGVQYIAREKSLMQIGKISKALNKQFDISTAVYFVDIDWDLLQKLSAKEEISYQPVPKFPVVRRDLALLLDEAVKFQEIEEVALKTERKLLKSVHLFDVYTGKGMPAGKKSYAVSFLFRSDDKTLQDKQVDDAVKRIYQQLTTATGASLRQGEI
jgi:phenylalanyl-tRNA synthetase beta chain